jgi:hypothetical protein
MAVPSTDRGDPVLHHPLEYRESPYTGCQGVVAFALRGHRPEADLAENEDDVIEVVPLPASDSQIEHNRIRQSNDRDQELERDGKPSRHNEGYDEAADLKKPGGEGLGATSHPRT